MKKEMKKSGFTLVEIMIVVAIIGLLAAIGIPSFQKARQNSIRKSAINNARMVLAGVDQYAMDNAITGGATVSILQYADFIKGGTANLKIGAMTPTLTAMDPDQTSIDAVTLAATMYTDVSF